MRHHSKINWMSKCDRVAPPTPFSFFWIFYSTQHVLNQDHNSVNDCNILAVSARDNALKQDVAMQPTSITSASQCETAPTQCETAPVSAAETTHTFAAFAQVKNDTEASASTLKDGRLTSTGQLLWIADSTSIITSYSFLWKKVRKSIFHFGAAATCNHCMRSWNKPLLAFAFRLDGGL